MKNKLIQQRTCIGCQNKDHRQKFLRITIKDDKLIIDKTGRVEGRGAYICPGRECFNKALKRRAFQYRLKKKITSKTIEDFKSTFEKEIV